MEFSPFTAVRAFHQALGADEPATPRIPIPSVEALRQTLLHEEYHELLEALKSGDLAAIAGEAADLLYVTYGLCVAYGIDADAVFEAVQRANLAKIHGPRRADGKLLKPADWIAPNIVAVLEQQAAQTNARSTIAVTITTNGEQGAFQATTATTQIEATITAPMALVGYATLIAALEHLHDQRAASVQIEAPSTLVGYLYVQQPIPHELRAIDQQARLLLASFGAWQAVSPS